MFRFLVNPASGGGRARRRLAELRRRADKAGAKLHVSCSGPDLTSQARLAARDGVERLVVAGGDGSMHLVAQGLAGSDTELAIIPSGRGDDLACSLGVPADFAAALELALTGDARRIDLGRVGGFFFPLYAGAGFDAECTATADGHPRWWPDALTYVIAVLRTAGGFRPPRAEIEWQDGRFDGEVMFVTACNAPRFGGGMFIAPEARMDDGLIDLVIVRAMSKLRLLLGVFPKVFSGRHVGHPAVSIHRTPWVRIRFEPAMLLGSDGELVGEVGREPLEVVVEPRALAVVTPTKVTALKDDQPSG